MGGVWFYLLFVYTAADLREHLHLDATKALEINTVGLLVVFVLTLPVAVLSERIGRKPILYATAIATLLLGWPLWRLLNQDNVTWIFVGQIGLAIIPAATFAVSPATIAEMLPTSVRASGASIGYNLCLGVFGGAAPLVATYLVARTGDNMTPAYYLMALALLLPVALRGMPETASRPLKTSKGKD